MDPRYADLIERTKRAQFRVSRISPGYDKREVDDLLDRIVEVLEDSALPDPEELRTVQFATTRLRPGYLQQDVDKLLRDLEAAVRLL